MCLRYAQLKPLNIICWLNDIMKLMLCSVHTPVVSIPPVSIKFKVFDTNKLLWCCLELTQSPLGQLTLYWKILTLFQYRYRHLMNLFIIKEIGRISLYA